MTDMLVKLYELPDDWSFLSAQMERGIHIRKPIGPENHLVVAWVRDNFGAAWASETDVSICNRPPTCFMAHRAGAPVGFACYDATALGFFGPGAVAEGYRGRGTGTALLLACLLEMKLKGYGYAIIGGVGPAAFYSKTVHAVEIPDSSPGVYRAMLKSTRQEKP